MMEYMAWMTASDGGMRVMVGQTIRTRGVQEGGYTDVLWER